MTELVGDIVITCTGGSFGIGTGAIVPGSSTPIPQANLIINMSHAVTSRLQGSCTPSVTAPCPSEATLLIDEPNSGLNTIVTGFGPGAPLVICTSVSGGCLEFPVATSTTFSGTPVVVAVNTAGQVPGSQSPGFNVFQGVVNGNQITFNGIPILPPVTSGISRVFRITNIRVNASQGGALAVTAGLSFSGPSSVPISNPSPTVGFINSSLATSVSNVAGNATTTSNVSQFTQCNLNQASLTTIVPGSANVALLNFTEKFPSAFKTRFNFASNNNASTFLGTTSAAGFTQNVPGALYNSESGFIVGLPNLPVAAGMADYGTRLMATFTNIPAGATLYVSRFNVANFTTNAAGVIAGPAGGNTTASIAQLTTSSTGGAFANPSGSTLVTVNGTSLSVAPVSGNTAVWEVVNTNPSALETISFAVFITFTPNLTLNQPTPTTAANQPMVTLSYNPIDLNAGQNPSPSVNTIPRFVNLPNTPAPLLGIVQCQTVLLFPYVTSQGGFDTGVAISNTSLDPLGPTATQQSSGTCTLNFFGAGAPTSPLTVPSSTFPTVLTFANGATTTPVANPTTIPAGGQIIFTTASIVPNFQGYMFASCTFQYAHGFAFVSDLGARNLAMGYLALVVNNGQHLFTRAGSSLAFAAEDLQN